MPERREEDLERRPPTILNPAEPEPVRRDPPFPPGPVHDSSTLVPRLFGSPYAFTVIAVLLAAAVVAVAFSVTR